MRNLYKLSNAIKHYDWGSPEWIPRLCGRDNAAGEPWAEMWMGVHPAGPSLLESDGEKITLKELIDRDPEAFLGDAAKSFGGLPYLLKLLAAAKPLSIQAHPALKEAKEGWERENRAGIALDDPGRNYKDANHKPEIISALSPFRALCGFRLPEVTYALLSLCETPALKRPREAAGDRDLRSFLTLLLHMDEHDRQELSAYIAAHWEKLRAELPPFGKEWELSAELVKFYPNDPAVIAPLYLHLVELKPGEALYLPAGVPHSYVRGLGVELMANSDNVLRGGLTPKHIDSGELCRILDFHPMWPEILRPENIQPEKPLPVPPGLFFHTYPAGSPEFSLSSLRGRGPEAAWPLEGPAVVLVTRGTAAFRAGKEELTLASGESAFIPAAARGIKIAGDYTASSACAASSARAAHAP